MAVPVPVAPRASRIDQLDGLRTLAFLGVFVFHALAVPLLWMGVDQFFVLSGYLITKNLLGLRGSSSPDDRVRGGELAPRRAPAAAAQAGLTVVTRTR